MHVPDSGEFINQLKSMCLFTLGSALGLIRWMLNWFAVMFGRSMTKHLKLHSIYFFIFWDYILCCNIVRRYKIKEYSWLWSDKHYGKMAETGEATITYVWKLCGWSSFFYLGVNIFTCSRYRTWKRSGTVTWSQVSQLEYSIREAVNF